MSLAFHFVALGSSVTRCGLRVSDFPLFRHRTRCIGDHHSVNTTCQRCIDLLAHDNQHATLLRRNPELVINTIGKVIHDRVRSSK